MFRYMIKYPSVLHAGRREQFFDHFVVSPDNSLLVFLGMDGYMPLVSNRTKQWVANLKMNGAVKDVSFTPDGSRLFSTGSKCVCMLCTRVLYMCVTMLCPSCIIMTSPHAPLSSPCTGDGKVYVWDMATRDCVHCFVDDGCVMGTTVSVSPDSKYVACGSDSGVVNIYDDQCLKEERPKPLKSIMSLTTSVKCTKFNPSRSGSSTEVSLAIRPLLKLFLHLQ